jgi:hypothetical protein
MEDLGNIVHRADQINALERYSLRLKHRVIMLAHVLERKSRTAQVCLERDYF